MGMKTQSIKYRYYGLDHLSHHGKIGQSGHAIPTLDRHRDPSNEQVGNMNKEGGEEYNGLSTNAVE